ncbi:hypothetical protein ACFFWB_26845 [Flavobacterium procerum]|uniref:hypothetical protein n=1 Tax=Flavobacterium procerum TaxID=1455569 RepID=UPI0035EA00D0
MGLLNLDSGKILGHKNGPFLFTNLKGAKGFHQNLNFLIFFPEFFLDFWGGFLTICPPSSKGDASKKFFWCFTKREKKGKGFLGGKPRGGKNTGVAEGQPPFVKFQFGPFLAFEKIRQI